MIAPDERWYHVGGSDKRMSGYIRVVGQDAPGISAVAQVFGKAQECRDRAALVAAAPRLFAALAALVDADENGVSYIGEYDDLMQDAREAIESARGPDTP